MGLTVAGRGVERPARSDRWTRLARPRVGHDSLLSNRVAQADPDPGHLGLPAQARGQERRRFQGGRRRGDVAAHGEHGPSLRAAQLGLTATLPLQRRQPADGDGHHQEEQQIEPLLGSGDGKRVEGLGEEEVVQKE